MADANPVKKAFFLVRFVVWLAGLIKAVVLGIVHFVVTLATQAWALVSDHEWDFDPYKLGGFAAFGFCAYVALEVMDMVKKPGADPALVGIVAGLVVTFVSVGTFLFSQSRKNDADLRDKGSGNGTGG